MARKALGRGLDALLPSVPATAGPGAQVATIETDRIRPNPQQPRERFDEAAIESMAASLREHGMLQPVVVRRVEDGYELIAGERRWRGAQRAGLERVPAVIRDASPRESLELALIENLQREDLNAIEVAQAYRLLVEEMGLTQEEAARRVGKERATVANYLRLLRLPDSVQAMLVEGRLEMGHARALLAAPDAAAQVRLAQEAIAKGWSVRQVEARARAVARPAARQRGRGGRRDPDVAAAEERLALALGTRVSIEGTERGRIVIRFASLEELNRIYELLLERGRG